MSCRDRTFLCDKSFNSLISRRAVIGNWGNSSGHDGQGQAAWPTYTILLVVHDDLLQRHLLPGPLASRAVDLTVAEEVSAIAPDSQDDLRTHPNVPSPSLPRMSYSLIREHPTKLCLGRRCARANDLGDGGEVPSWSPVALIANRESNSMVVNGRRRSEFGVAQVRGRDCGLVRDSTERRRREGGCFSARGNR